MFLFINAFINQPLLIFMMIFKILYQMFRLLGSILIYFYYLLLQINSYPWVFFSNQTILYITSNKQFFNFLLIKSSSFLSHLYVENCILWIFCNLFSVYRHGFLQLKDKYDIQFNSFWYQRLSYVTNVKLKLMVKYLLAKLVWQFIYEAYLINFHFSLL